MQNILKNIALNGTKRGKKMSREIKFRIWDKINRMWLRCFNVNLFDIGDLPNVELMQYTGVKDKNGKEIYEGDIVKYKFPYDTRLKHISPVKFLETEVSFGIKDIYGNEIPLYTISANNYFEVIGNIYKNKNLLEESR